MDRIKSLVNLTGEAGAIKFALIGKNIRPRKA
jgi:hypothetical protein